MQVLFHRYIALTCRPFMHKCFMFLKNIYKVKTPQLVPDTSLWLIWVIFCHDKFDLLAILQMHPDSNLAATNFSSGLREEALFRRPDTRNWINWAYSSKVYIRREVSFSRYKSFFCHFSNYEIGNFDWIWRQTGLQPAEIFWEKKNIFFFVRSKSALAPNSTYFLNSFL